MTKPWIPSNGTGGEMFRLDWCDKCSRETTIRECGILTRTLIYKPGERDYPKEWVADDDGWSNPRCTAFKARTRNGLRSKRIRDRRQADMLGPL